ncbi:MAG: hypothetical protein WDN03_00505 [Rhizomicrobium sp.]
MTTNAQDAGDAVARTHPRHWIGINAEDIPQGWIDDMVKRLFEELNRQILRVENAQHADPRATPPTRPATANATRARSSACRNRSTA